MEQEKISDFYDNFVQKQLKIGANERLISLLKRLLKLGLNKNSRVLELGCGVGIFTGLLAKKIEKGFIEAVDLSEKSVETARNNLKTKKNIHFQTADVVYYKPKQSDFDFITLMDVIEHIPLTEHPKLFQNLADISTEKTKIIINIPNPDYTAFTKIHNPETLQIIDQEVEILPILQHLQNTGLEMIFFEKYSIWQKEDYHFMIIRKKRKFVLKTTASERNLIAKILNKINKTVDKLRFS
ncbi:class I SAM-dependent methyltransferase [Halpernia frigidisoli]|uniref:Methyltransferase domain-containing protein n=1 Tax=Halpernia frigidisoli TaxID=1125876 RepID=A0A1I3GIJ6_9FLAO|nr:class I SAM-dependent methyltransferase [Halpernia frigidisoli]SFI23335.1 Methyltransferase domain-containing protein [Halpernia frigidisoli]